MEKRNGAIGKSWFSVFQSTVHVLASILFSTPRFSLLLVDFPATQSQSALQLLEPATGRDLFRLNQQRPVHSCYHSCSNHTSTMEAWGIKWVCSIPNRFPKLGSEPSCTASTVCFYEYFSVYISCLFTSKSGAGMTFQDIYGNESRQWSVEHCS